MRCTSGICLRSDASHRPDLKSLKGVFQRMTSTVEKSPTATNVKNDTLCKYYFVFWHKNLQDVLGVIPDSEGSDSVFSFCTPPPSLPLSRFHPSLLALIPNPPRPKQEAGMSGFHDADEVKTWQCSRSLSPPQSDPPAQPSFTSGLLCPGMRSPQCGEG